MLEKKFKDFKYRVPGSGFRVPGFGCAQPGCSRLSFVSYLISHISYLLIPVSCLLSPVCLSQVVLDTVLPKYPFVVVDSNIVYNDSVALQPFYEKLVQVQQTKEGRVNVVHIGDSHIQADHFSGKLRQDLQCDFGNAGRGFVFPYRVAKTNEPISYKTSTNVAWQYKRNVFPEQPLPIGIGGITIETGDTAAEIKLMVKDQEGLDYSFTKLTLFHDRSEENFDFAVYDSLYNEIGYVNNSIAGENKYTSVLTFDKPYRNIIIKSCPRNTSQTCAQIFGMLLENDKPGILYNMIGVNGAEYKHYSRSRYFVEQLPLLKPDLVIISLGTNEGYTAAFDKDKFYGNIDTLVTAIRKANPGAAFLLTTPGDSFRRTRKGRVKNPDMLDARNTVIRYCKNNNLAYWDLYAVMGGYGSMAQWYKAKLTAKDRLHFGARGYMIQAGLMYKAIITKYNKYVENRK